MKTILFSGWLNNPYYCIKVILIFLFFTAIPNRTYPVTIVLTSDQQLSDLMDPDKKIDLSTIGLTYFASLREICESAQKSGDKLLTIAFDEFFRQYRDQDLTERRLTPDMDEYIEKIKFISDFASQYGMNLGLSLLSPLELGSAYKNNTGESGRWLHYKTGHRDPTSGKFSVSMWQQLSWVNNKGKFSVNLKRVRAFAFREMQLEWSHFRAVLPDDIIEIQGVEFEGLDTVNSVPVSEIWVDYIEFESRDMFEKSEQGDGFKSRNLRVFYDGEEQLLGYDRVMVILEYETPEMDYFSPHALPFLKDLLKKYHENDINLVSLYSDEMHIQQDWYYFDHHENGQFSTRYLTPHFSNAYKERFGHDLEDKHMLYFIYGAPMFESTARAVRNIQYVMGTEPEDIHRTFLLRDRYYKMLNHDVTDLFLDAKNYAENLFGWKMAAHGHASWAQSPTIDLWDTEKLRENAAKYEYTSNYIWGNTVQQAAAGCYDYFKWGEYLEPTGNDFAECGWLDRNYYGAAMAASIGVVNKYPNAYAAAGGMPQESMEWKVAVNNAFGSYGYPSTSLITGGVHRDIEVLILYPMNLVAAEERFGSWMTQYAYANYLTSEKLMEIGFITEDGYLKVADKIYNTLVAVFELLPHKELLEFMNRFAEKGGNVVWFGPPPLLYNNGNNCVSAWQQLFGVKYVHNRYMGEIAAGKKVVFRGSFSDVPEQIVLTDFLVDRFYPVQAESACEVVAESGDLVLGTRLRKGRGNVYYFGFRPRDDQSASLGYETRTMFEILNKTGAYKGSGKFPDVNDNPTYISRNTDYLVTRFPNNSNVIVKHYRTHAENWHTGYARNREADEKALAVNPLPADTLVLINKKINGHKISCSGKLRIAYRIDSSGQLIAFEGHNCKDFIVDGTRYEFSVAPFETIAFVPQNNDPSDYLVIARGTGKISLPIPLDSEKILTIYAHGNKKIRHRIVDGLVELEINQEISGTSLRFIQSSP